MSERLRSQEQEPSREYFKNQETMEFPDGTTAFGYRTKGDRGVLGHNSLSSHARNFDVSTRGEKGVAGSLAVITTESGNQYVLGNGVVVNTREHTAGHIPEEIDLTIGEPAYIDGVGTTTAVTSVVVRDPKRRRNDDFPPQHKLSAENPFDEFERMTIDAAAAAPEKK